MWLEGGSVGRESACNAGDAGDADSVPGSGRFPGEGAWQLTQVLSGDSHGQRWAWHGLQSIGLQRVGHNTRLSMHSAISGTLSFCPSILSVSNALLLGLKKKKNPQGEGAPEPPRFTSSSSKEWRKSFSLCHSYHLAGRRIFPRRPSRFSLSSHCPGLSQMPTPGPCSTEGKKDDRDWLRVRPITIASGPGTMLSKQEEASICEGKVVSVGQIPSSIYHVPERV